MSSPFSQTTRSLEADTVRCALFAWVPALLLLGAWSAWFIGGAVTEIAVSEHARVDRTGGPAGGSIVAAFAPSEALGRVQPGQTAWFRIDGGAVALNARVRQVDTQVHDGRVRVELEPLTDGAAALSHGLAGVAEVAVGQAAPAWLLARAIGMPAPASNGR